MRITERAGDFFLGSYKNKRKRVWRKKAIAIMLVVFTALFFFTRISRATSFKEEVRCLALNVYHEARGASQLDKILVAEAVINRTQSNHFPQGVCAVVYQPGQFSWTEDGFPDDPKNSVSYKEAVSVAMAALKREVRLPAALQGITFFCVPSACNKWHEREKRKKKLERVVYIQGGHTYYRLVAERSG